MSASVSISAPPASEVSLTPSGTGLTFSPAVLHFTSDGALTQSVSVLGAQAGSMQVVYEVGGADASDFVAPAPASIEFLALGGCALHYICCFLWSHCTSKHACQLRASFVLCAVCCLLA